MMFSNCRSQDSNNQNRHLVDLCMVTECSEPQVCQRLCGPQWNSGKVQGQWTDTWDSGK